MWSVFLPNLPWIQWAILPAQQWERAEHSVTYARFKQRSSIRFCKYLVHWQIRYSRDQLEDRRSCCCVRFGLSLQLICISKMFMFSACQGASWRTLIVRRIPSLATGHSSTVTSTSQYFRRLMRWICGSSSWLWCWWCCCELSSHLLGYMILRTTVW